MKGEKIFVKSRIIKIACMMQVGLLLLWAFSTGSPLKASAATVNEQFKVSSGVNYTDFRISESTRKQAVRVMEVNVNDPYTNVEVGVSSIMNKLKKTTTHALEHHYDGHLVVGAINASFFHLGAPINLVSQNNKLVHAGTISSSKDKYINEPIAFGMNSNGKGQIDHYDLSMNYVHNGKTYKITSTNKERSTNNTILYTPYFPSETTNTNEWGTEVVVTFPEAPTLEFGSQVTGTVEQVRNVGDKTKTIIPKNGVVISGNGKGSDQLKDVMVGDSITLSIDIDSKWKDSSFMVASGPMLVKDGRVSLSMNPNSSEAATRAPRTAVAINKTGDKVFFVTVDGRQSGYSTGMNLTEFANYLVSMGADRALNLDGGGSTTMAVRYPGTDTVRLANKPSDGVERTVSTILMAVSTAPKGEVRSITVKKSKEGKLSIGDSIKILPGTAVDTYYNPVKLSESDLSLEDVNKLGSVSGNTFTAKKPGKGTIKVKYGNVSTTVNIEIADNSTSSFKDVSNSFWGKTEIEELVKKGIITGYPDGTFKPNNTISRGETAVMLTRTLKLDTSNVKDPGFKDVSKSNMYYKEIAAAANAGLIKGREKDKFVSNGKLSRAEMAVLIQRAFKLPYENNKYFSDVPSSHYAYQSINSIAKLNITEGYPDGTYRPNNSITRAEFSVFLTRALK